MIQATIKMIDSRLMIPVHDIDQAKVSAMNGVSDMPAPVVADFGDFLIPIDGHHRISAATGSIEAWVFDGEEVEDIEWNECEMYCGDMLAMQVAGNNTGETDNE